MVPLSPKIPFGPASEKGSSSEGSSSEGFISEVMISEVMISESLKSDTSVKSAEGFSVSVVFSVELFGLHAVRMQPAVSRMLKPKALDFILFFIILPFIFSPFTIAFYMFLFKSYSDVF